jgi:hypothetical protein
MAGKQTRQQFAAKMAQLAREHERKADAKAASEDRFAGEQQRLKEAFLARSQVPSEC